MIGRRVCQIRQPGWDGLPLPEPFYHSVSACLALAMPVSSFHQPPNRETRAEKTLTELKAPGILSKCSVKE